MTKEQLVNTLKEMSDSELKLLYGIITSMYFGSSRELYINYPRPKLIKDISDYLIEMVKEKEIHNKEELVNFVLSKYKKTLFAVIGLTILVVIISVILIIKFT